MNKIPSFFYLIIHTLGTYCWIYLYKSGQFTEWWVFPIIGICGLSAILSFDNFLSKFRDS